jgi:hypothetical protein
MGGKEMAFLKGTRAYYVVIRRADSNEGVQNVDDKVNFSAQLPKSV